MSSEVSFDVQLVVCMGECTQIFWIRFGVKRFLRCHDANNIFCVCCCSAALLRNVDPVMLSMQKHEVSCVIKRFPVFSIQHLDS